MVDILRVIAIVETGVMVGLMSAILYVASKVLIPHGGAGKTTGFVLWHIIGIVFGVSMVVAVAVDGVLGRLGTDELTWRTPVFLIGISTIIFALVIIFRVELRRMQRKRGARNGDRD